MFDLATYLVYILLLLFLACGTYFVSIRMGDPVLLQRERLDVSYFFFLLIISFVVGFRYQVGNDWPGYVGKFNEIKHIIDISPSAAQTEWGFFWINRIVAVLGLGYQWMFFTVAMVTWYFYFKSVPKVIIPLLIYFLFVTGFFFWGMNGVRQFAAMAIWLCALKFMVKRDFKLYLLLIFVASLFHSSVLILVPLYFIPFDKLYNRSFLFIVYIISLGFIFFINLGALHRYFDIVTLFLGKHFDVFKGYDYYINNDLMKSRDLEVGFGFYFKLLINGFIIWVSKDIVKYQEGLKSYFVLFTIGTVLFNLFYDFQLINRLSNYFLILEPILLSFICYIYWHKFWKTRRWVVVSLFILCFIFFLSSIYKNANMCSPYDFRL